MTAYNPLPSHGLSHLVMQRAQDAEQRRRNKRAQYGFYVVVLASLAAYQVATNWLAAMDAEQQRQQAMTEQKR